MYENAVEADGRYLVDPLMNNIGSAVLRSAENSFEIGLAPDTTIVSADGHIEICHDVFYEDFPETLKDRAPRVWFDRIWHIGEEGVPGEADELIEKAIPSGVWDMDLRIEHLGTEGIQKELLYPQSLLGFLRYGDHELQETLYRVYNEYIADRARTAPGLFYGVGVISNWWDPDKAERAVRQIVDLGLKTFMMPGTLGKDLMGNALAVSSPEMHRFWHVVEEAGLPVSFHTGERHEPSSTGALAANMVINLGMARKPFSQLIFGGVFDRCPNLKIVFAEYGLSWVLSALQDAEMVFDSFGNGSIMGPALRHRPSHYWHNNCYATFMNDRFGLRNLDYLGADRVMWSSDYPHSEGSFGFSWSSMKAVIDATSPEVARKILGGTAIDLYKL